MPDLDGFDTFELPEADDDAGMTNTPGKKATNPLTDKIGVEIKDLLKNSQD